MKIAFHILLITLLLMAGCGRPAETTLSAELQRAEDLMYPHPDSALHILQDMTPPKDELNRATWALLLKGHLRGHFVFYSLLVVLLLHFYQGFVSVYFIDGIIDFL